MVMLILQIPYLQELFCAIDLRAMLSDESAVLIRQLIEATKQAKQMDECLAVGSAHVFTCNHIR
jgi:hypothetical protein